MSTHQRRNTTQPRATGSRLGRLSALTLALTMSLMCLHTPAASARASEGSGAQDSRHQDKHRRSHERIKHIRGVTVTGVNSVRGKPFFDWGPPFGTFNFPSIFVYNEGGTEPLRIDEHTPDSAILATGISDEYLLIRGETWDVVKPEWLNVPLRKWPILIDFGNVRRLELRGLNEADPLELSQSEPANDITLGQWMKASGHLTLTCSKRQANVKLRMKNLIPNRTYSVWATASLPDTVPGEPGRYASTLPIGGTPNVFVTDGNGDAAFERAIKFCPYDTQLPAGGIPTIPVLNIEVLYHGDHQTYGAIPAPGLMLGLVTFSHVVFPIDVKLLDQ
jgi:hypothetical protein